MFSCVICETFKNCGGFFWKCITYYVIKNYLGHYLSHLQCCPFTLFHLLLTWWWDIRLEHDVVWLWEEQAGSKNVCLKQKEALLMLYYIDKNWYHFIKEYLKNTYKICFSRGCLSSWVTRHILEILLACRHTLVAQNHQTSATTGYTTAMR